MDLYSRNKWVGYLTANCGPDWLSFDKCESIFLLAVFLSSLSYSLIRIIFPVCRTFSVCDVLFHKVPLFSTKMYTDKNIRACKRQLSI